MGGRHRGEPADEAPGVLPILDGIVHAVHNEALQAYRANNTDAATDLADAVGNLRSARQLVELARGKVARNGEG